MGSQHARVGVRELRQNLSVYLRRVERGETLEVTERGRSVAVLAPLPVGEPSTLDRLIAAGTVTPAARPGGLLPRPVETRGPRTASEILAEMREHER